VNSAFVFVSLLFGLLCFASAAIALPPEIEAVLDSRLKNRNLGPIYKPVLPRDGYINKSQAELAKTARPLETYIRFIDPKDEDVSTFETRGIKAKEWTELERNDVHRIFQHIFLTTPGLIMRAASGDQICLVRTTNIRLPETLSTDMKHTDGMAASAAPLAVNFADQFFTTPKQCHGLVHELIHAADYYGQIANSKEWIDFAEPTISRIRIKLNFLSAFEKRELAMHLLRGGDWVSLYGCENLIEALAEYTSTYITDRERDLDSDFERLFADKLLMPTAKDLEAARHYKLGYSAFNHDKFEEAIAELSKCIAIDTTAAMPHMRLAVCFAMEKNLDKAEAEAQISEDCYRKEHIPLDDAEFGYLLEWKSTIAYRKGNWDQSIKILDDVLEHQPPTRDKYYARFWAKDRGELRGPASLDLYEWNCKNAVADYIYSGTSDQEYTLKFLDADVTRFPRLGLPLARRGRFLEALGDAPSNAGKKKDYYARAFSDFSGTIGKPDRAQDRAYLDSGRVCYKLGNRSPIQTYVNKMTADPPSDERTVLQILLDDANIDRETAAKEYKAFKYKILPRRKMRQEAPQQERPQQEKQKLENPLDHVSLK
jgi:tetratricopeptide (TPR) repeat protein